MFWIIVGLVLLLSVVLIIMVILQPSKGGGSLGSAFGGLGASLGSTFGSRRTLDFLAKGTTYVAAMIAALCLIANIFFVPTASETGTTPITTGVGGAPAPAAAPLPRGGTQPGAPAPSAGGQAPAAQPQTAPDAAPPAGTQSGPGAAPSATPPPSGGQ